MNKLFLLAVFGTASLVFADAYSQTSGYSQPYGGEFAPTPVDNYRNQYYQQNPSYETSSPEGYNPNYAPPYGGQFAPTPLSDWNNK